MTPEQIAANRAAAVVAVRAAQGLTGLDVSAWSYEQRMAYNKALAAYIAARPAQFSPAEWTTAARLAQVNYSPLADVSLASRFSEFADEFTNNVVKAGNQVGGVGRGVLNTFSVIGWAIPVIALGAAVYLSWHYIKKAAQ